MKTNEQMKAKLRNITLCALRLEKTFKDLKAKAKSSLKIQKAA